MVNFTKVPSIESLKRRAKAIAKSEGVPHNQALDLAAKYSGFSNFRHFCAASKAVDADQHIVLTIELDGSDLSVSRTLSVPAGLNFEQLHGAIQLAMGWLNAHLYQFEFADHPTLTDSESVDEHMPEDGDMLCNACDYRLNQLFAQGVRSFVYRYDFGDGWCHTISILGLAPVASTKPTITLLDATGLCPPEDAGGVYRFNDMLNAFSEKHDPERFAKLSHPDRFGLADERREIARWIGRSYHPYKPVKPLRHQKALTLFTNCGFDFDRFADEAGWDDGAKGFNPNIHYDIFKQA